MNTFNLRVEAEIQVTTRDGVDNANISNTTLITYSNENNLYDLDKNNLLDHARIFILNDIELAYYPTIKTELVYIKLLSVCDNKTKEVRCF